jgi:4-hydroxymandelate oxidase
VDPAARTWMQMYIGRDRGMVRALAQRAQAAGCDALVLTVDTPVWGIRERDIRNHFRVPDGLRIVHLERPGGPTGHTGSGIQEALSWTIDASLTWKDFEWLRDSTPLPVILKGVCRPEDAKRGVELGAKGILVSNHGGRQLDGSPATVEVLPHCVEAVGGRVPVLVDGGVRRGTDILRALALGAQAVCIGRPVLWGLATAGEQGIERVLGILKQELDVTLALAGCANQSKPRTVVDEAKLADCIAREGAHELEAGATADVAAETIALACGTDAATVIRDLVFGKRAPLGSRAGAIQAAGRP